MKVSVFHNVHRDAFFGLNARITGKGKVYTSCLHPLVKVFEFDLAELFGQDVRQSPDAIAAETFMAFNVGHQDEYAGTDMHELAGKYRARRLRSVSVGDVLSLNGYWMTCASCGWAKAREEELLILEGSKADRAIRDRLGLLSTEELTHTVPLEG